MEIVRYKCGCIGFYPPIETGKCLILEYCAPDCTELRTLGVSDVCIKDPENHTPLTQDEVVSMFNKIGTLIRYGYNFQTIAMIFKSYDPKKMI